MITTRLQALTFGAINLIGTKAELTANGFNFECLADGTEWGNPVPIEQKIISWLQDGALLSLSGYDNRDDMTIRIRITGSDSNKLALGEQALMLETGKPNALTWTPPDGAGAPCVFDVVMSSLSHSMDDLGELRSPRQRIYTLRLKCLPFARSSDLITATYPAPAGAQVITSVDACTSFTGWAGSAPGAGSMSTGVSGGVAVFVRGNAYPWPGAQTLTLARTGLSASITTTPYIRVETSITRAGIGSISPPVFTVNGVAVPVASQSGSFYWLDTTGLGLGATMVSLSVAQTFEPGDNGPNVTLTVADVSRSNVLGTVATGRQLVRTVEVAGSARTQASLSLADAATGLGDVLIFTSPASPDVPQPNLRQYLVPGPTQSVAAANVSGFSSDLATPHTFAIPMAGIEPGAYAVIGRMAAAGAATLNWITSALVSGQLVASGVTNQQGSWSGTPAAAYSFHQIATLMLPFVTVGTAGQFLLSVTATGPVILDDFWLLNLTTGQVTMVKCGTGPAAAGTVFNRLWVDTPSAASPTLGVFAGTQADRSDQIQLGGSKLISLGNHEFAPPAQNIMTVTTGSTAAALTVSHRRRFHTHVVA